jgi:hypothetical protein
LSVPQFADDFRACRSIAEPAERLECYDSLTAPTAESTAAAMETPTGQDRSVEADADFGLPDFDASDETLTAGVATIEFDRFDRVQITLDNGQVWKQLDSDRRRVQIDRRSPPSSATVESGAFGSYRMTLEPSRSRSFKVKRLR